MTTSPLTDPHGLTEQDITDAITGSAQHCAARHVEDGWNLLPTAYRLATFPDDQADLASLLGRVPTYHEQIRLELAIQALLAAAMEAAAEKELASVEARHDGDREARCESE